MVHPPAPLLLPFPSEFTLFARNLAPSYRALPLGPLPPGRTSPRPSAFWRSANNPTTTIALWPTMPEERRGEESIDSGQRLSTTKQHFRPPPAFAEIIFGFGSNSFHDYEGVGGGGPLLLTKIRQEGIPLCEDKSYECTENDLQASIKCLGGEVWTEI